MANPQARAMTPEEFEAWHRDQLERYEYIDGHPQLKFASWEGNKMMVGASQAHNLVTGNVFAAIRQSLKGQTCRVFAADGKVVTPKGNYRYPDVTVDCGAFDPKATVLAQPALVVEVLSKATHWIDTTRKLEEYKAIASMRYILFLSQEDFRAQLWTRGDAWQLREYEGLGSTLPLPPFAPALTFAAIYEGIEFES